MRVIKVLAICLLLGWTVFGQKTAKENNLAAPNFNVTSIDGKSFDSEKLKGKIVVVNLWFINCPNCVEEIKALNKIVDDYQNKDVVFIGMATNKKADLDKFLMKNPFKFNVIPTATQTILSFGEKDKNGQIDIPFPMHVVINREGQIVVRVSGTKGVKAVENELKKQFETE